jgi:hypothetical protein
MSDKQENGRALSPEQRQLITHYIETRSYVDAYRRVHPDCDNDGHRTTVAFRAARAFTKPMREEIARLDDIAKEAEQKAIERSAKEAAKLWSKFDSVKSYVNLVKKCEKQIDEETERGEGVNTRVADTMRGTIDSLNKMLGYNEPDKQSVDSVIRVVFGGGASDDGVSEGSLEEYAE